MASFRPQIRPPGKPRLAEGWLPIGELSRSRARIKINSRDTRRFDGLPLRPPQRPGVAWKGPSHYVHKVRGRSARTGSHVMARSTNILLACVAMLGAMLLAVEMKPHNLMARTHESFNIDQHLPTQFGDWKPVEGLNVVAPPAAGFARSHDLQPGGVARLRRSRRARGDADGRLWREPERPPAAPSSGSLLHGAGLPRVADERVEARLFPCGAAAQG